MWCIIFTYKIYYNTYKSIRNCSHSKCITIPASCLQNYGIVCTAVILGIHNNKYHNNDIKMHFSGLKQLLYGMYLCYIMDMGFIESVTNSSSHPIHFLPHVSPLFCSVSLSASACAAAALLMEGIVWFY